MRKLIIESEQNALRCLLLIGLFFGSQLSSLGQTDSTQMRIDSSQVVFGSNKILAIQIAGRAIECGLRQGNSASLSAAYINRGELLLQAGQFGNAVSDFQKAFQLQQNQNVISNQQWGQLYLGITKAFLAISKFDDALKWCDSALADKRASGPLTTFYEFMFLKSEAFFGLGQLDNSKKILLDLLANEKQNMSSSEEANTLFRLGLLHKKIGELEKAESYLIQASKISVEQRFTDLSLSVNDELADIYRANQNSKMELDVRNSNLALNAFNNDATGVAIQNFEIGNAYLQQGNIALAENYIQKGLEVAPINPKDGQLDTKHYTSEDLRHGASALKNLAIGFQKNNDLQKALSYYRDYAEMLDSANAMQRRELESAISLSNDLGKNQSRIELLERENELNNKNLLLMRDENILKAEQLSRRNIVIISLGLLLLLFVVFGFVLVKNTKARRRSEMLVALQSMNGQMNPHFIFNALNSVNEYVARNDEREANKFISTFSKLMRRVLDDSGKNFISLSDELEMLRVYIQLEHSRFPEKFDYEMRVDHRLDADDVMIPPMLIQPLIENAIWHGLRYRNIKGRLQLSCFVENEKIVVIVEDDGVGIDKSTALKTGNQKQHRSHALNNMKQRMDILNQVFHCELKMHTGTYSTDPNFPGTRVRIELKQLSQDIVTLMQG
jgi:tetratricopeptide (TPR) repeat protein